MLPGYGNHLHSQPDGRQAIENIASAKSCLPRLVMCRLHGLAGMHDGESSWRAEQGGTLCPAGTSQGFHSAIFGMRVSSSSHCSISCSSCMVNCSSTSSSLASESTLSACALNKISANFVNMRMENEIPCHFALLGTRQDALALPMNWQSLESGGSDITTTFTIK